MRPRLGVLPVEHHLTGGPLLVGIRRNAQLAVRPIEQPSCITRRRATFNLRATVRSPYPALIDGFRPPECVAERYKLTPKRGGRFRANHDDPRSGGECRE